jgi:hypothetical protein
VSAIHIPLVAYHEKAIRQFLGKSPDIVPIFKPINLSMYKSLPAALLEEGLRGTLIDMKAANQYTMITSSEGETLARGTLKELIERLPIGSGVRLHRSCWVTNNILEGGALDPVSRVLTTRCGRTYSIGVTRVADVKALLNLHK